MKRLLPDSKVRQRYGVSACTLYRWDRNSALKFPRPTKINGRNYRDEDELNQFDQARAAEREVETTA
jgi:predicted DNA-binding transcriptional regulator AlpA